VVGGRAGGAAAALCGTGALGGAEATGGEAAVAAGAGALSGAETAGDGATVVAGAGKASGAVATADCAGGAAEGAGSAEILSDLATAPRRTNLSGGRGHGTSVGSGKSRHLDACV